MSFVHLGGPKPKIGINPETEVIIFSLLATLSEKTLGMGMVRVEQPFCTILTLTFCVKFFKRKRDFKNFTIGGPPWSIFFLQPEP